MQVLETPELLRPPERGLGTRNPCSHQTLGQFALVSYIPDPFARFLDDLRTELMPDCNPRAHITVLPPRPVLDDIPGAVRLLGERASLVPSFQIETADIEIFDTSSVVYLGILQGIPHLRSLYGAMNCRNLAFCEPFPYHPHITIAQGLAPGEAHRIAAVARERWAAYSGPRGFEVRDLCFVQHVAPGIWADVARVPLASGLVSPGNGTR